MDNPWPADIPWSLWNYQGLTISDMPQLPMMGVRFEPSFLYAFAFGCFFVAFFSWPRFKARGRNINATSEALRDFDPTDLGGQNSLHRAYFIYAGAMLILYVSLTFFGKLIFQATQMIPVAGISVDIAELKFDSPQWPLTLAFAFAGLADLLPPVRIAEEWLRNRAYRAAGIPVRIEQTTRSLIATLEEPPGHSGERREHLRNRGRGSLAEMLGHFRKNWQAQIDAYPRVRWLLGKRTSRTRELLALLSQLELLIVWAKTTRGSWPGAEVSARVRETEAKFVDSADALLNSFQRRLQETGDPNATDPAHAELHAGEARPANPDLRASEAQPANAGLHASEARFDDYISQVMKDATAVRFELVTLLAIFLERDPDFRGPARAPKPGLAHPIDALADLLLETDRPDAVGSGPEAGLLLSLIPVFILFAASAWQGAQELVSQYVETTNLAGVLLTALVETLKIASLTWLPLLAAFSLRQYRWDTKDWVGAQQDWDYRNSSRLSQMMGCLALALAVSILGLTGVAMLRAFAIAQNANHFNSLLFGGSAPFMLYYPTLAVTLLPMVPMCLAAADARAHGRPVLGHAVLCAALVLVLSIAHSWFWDPNWPDACFKAETIATAECSRRSDTLSRLILTVLVFLASWNLGQPGFSRTRRRINRKQAEFVCAVLMAATFVLSTPVFARDVRVGFRDNVEPFSYLVGDGHGKAHHIGYLADLCHEIFAVGEYTIEEVSVTTAERFKLVNGDTVGDKKPVDVLCDTVTMRFSGLSISANGDSGDDADGRSKRDWNSIYSPIVFASGVSYLVRYSREATTYAGDVVIGYVSATTAADVAFKSCQVDFFKGLAPTQRKALYERCRFLDAAAAVRRRIAMLLPDNPGSRASAPASSEKAMPDHASVSPEIELPPDFKTSLEKALQSAKNLAPLSILPDTTSFLPLPSQEMANNLITTVGKICGSSPNTSGDQAAQSIVLCDDALKPDPLKLISAAVTDPRCNPDEKKELSDADKKKRSWREYHFCPMKDYGDLIRWFCSPNPGLRPVFMGDRELILGKLDSWNARNTPCAVEQLIGAEYLTYEPYALLVSKDDPELVQFVQRRVYQIFSHRSTATARFASYFPKRSMSSALAYLYLLNAVDPEQGYLVPCGTPDKAQSDGTGPASAVSRPAGDIRSCADETEKKPAPAALNAWLAAAGERARSILSSVLRTSGIIE
ncbi:hypothetical protein FHX06_001213 [Rhizobium sp. BK512]|uniref:hypothetical protein n=1 Tax=Rhizobium sp. BK512 TaxID=2587010 RepID=UPI000DD610A6|nr:hypothetical protein [Rhizobium sp. BK512]MBB3559902.1 hypothetical protein [Rhizobium sp. BK512]